MCMRVARSYPYSYPKGGITKVRKIILDFATNFYDIMCMRVARSCPYSYPKGGIMMIRKICAGLLCACLATGLCEARLKQKRTNVIAGNKCHGVAILNGSNNNAVRNALIGMSLCKKALGNGKDGVLIAHKSKDNQIEGNVIVNNCKGIVVGTSKQDCSDGNAIEGNVIYNNTKIGIDLANDGRTKNHKKNPVKRAPNGFQNFPKFKVICKGKNVIAHGSLCSAKSSRFKLEFFKNDRDRSPATDGQRLIQTIEVTTNAQGKAEFSIELPGIRSKSFVSATATALDGPRNTSELSPNVKIRTTKKHNA